MLQLKVPVPGMATGSRAGQSDGLLTDDMCLLVAAPLRKQACQHMQPIQYYLLLEAH